MDAHPHGHPHGHGWMHVQLVKSVVLHHGLHRGPWPGLAGAPQKQLLRGGLGGRAHRRGPGLWFLKLSWFCSFLWVRNYLKMKNLE